MDSDELYRSIAPRYPELTGQVALITGSSKGIGKGIAMRLAREGMKVVINARNAEQVAATTAELRGYGAEALAVPADVGTREGCERLIAQTLTEYGRLDLLVNNAANMVRRPVGEVADDLWDAAVAANLTGPWTLARRAVEPMRAQGGGVIVQISTVGGLRAHWPGLPYDATKAALDAMTRSLGIELAEVGIRVNGLAPGATRQEQRPIDRRPSTNDYARRIPIRRAAVPLEMAAVVAFLASDEASYIVGQTIYVDGGLTAQLAPSVCPV